jgi:hypothetical protein
VKVVFDTTVFENGFNPRSAEVPLLKNFLVRTRSELYVPAIVHEEALNRVRKRVTEANAKIGAVQRLTGGSEGFKIIKPEDAMATYAETLKILFGDLDAQLLPLPTVSHADVLKRALAAKKPFVDSGRGYRDALIWHNIVELLRASSDQIVFVSQNSDDWCGGRKDAFHPDLVAELGDEGLQSERLMIVPSLFDFNRKYTVSSLSVELTEPPDERPPDYLQLLIDARELIESQLVVALPNALSRIGADVQSIGEFGALGLNGPTNVNHSPPRTLDSERRLLEFSAQYRVSLDVIMQRSAAAWWIKHFSFQLRRDWHYDQIRAYVTVPVRASFHLIERGENTEQFSLAALEISEDERQTP